MNKPAEGLQWFSTLPDSYVFVIMISYNSYVELENLENAKITGALFYESSAHIPKASKSMQEITA